MAENPSSSSISFNFAHSETDIKINALTILVAAIFLFLTLIFIFLLYYYLKHHWRSRSARRPARTIFAAQNLPAPSRGLDHAVLSAIPITLFKPSEVNNGIECAVCLSELAAGEEVRLLPKCGHGFHLECIDTWFQSQSTCPICRCAVGSEAVEDNDESSGLPANVLFWGNRDGVNQLVSEEGNSDSLGISERNLMISIPVRSTEGIIASAVSPLASGRSRVEEMKSPVEDRRSPVTPKMWSLRRILSMGKRTGGSSSSSPRNVGDIEQGLAGSGAENGEGSSSNFSPKNSL